jgi:hypothetical protein
MGKRTSPTMDLAMQNPMSLQRTNRKSNGRIHEFFSNYSAKNPDQNLAWFNKYMAQTTSAHGEAALDF